jgi:hypothetical protein
MAFVKTRVYLDQRKADQIIEILYENTVANEPLERSILTLGHSILPTDTDQKTGKSSATKNHTVDRPYQNTVQLKRIVVQVKK